MKKQKKMIIGGVTVGIVACLTLGATDIQKHHKEHIRCGKSDGIR